MHIHILVPAKYNSQQKTAFIMRQSVITVFAELTVNSLVHDK